jgi:hypothetical protein
MEASDNFGLTPYGVAQHPHINSPNTRFSGAGVYSISLSVPVERADALISQIDEKMRASFDAALEKAESVEKKGRVRMADAPYTMDDDGRRVNFSFRIKARGVGKDRKPFRNHVKIYDAKGKARRLKVATGAEVRLTFRYESFNSGLVGAGVARRPLAVQVVKLASESPEHFGFTDSSLAT